MLGLSGLDSDSMTDDQRDAFINMAENLGIDPGEAEDVVDDYLEDADKRFNDAMTEVASAAPRVEVVQNGATPPAPVPESAPEPELSSANEAQERAQFINFQNSLGGQMLFVPSGQFVMGSENPDAAPNERPITRVSVSRYYLSRHLITNATTNNSIHRTLGSARPGQGIAIPVVYVSSLEAIKFCRVAQRPRAQEISVCRPRRNGNTRRGGLMDGDIHGAIMKAVAIWPISPTRTPFLPGAIAKSMMVMRRRSPVGAFPSGGEPLRHGRHGAATFGNGASITTSRIAVRPKVNPRGPIDRGETNLPRRQLEIAFQQLENDRARIKRPEFFLQRSRFSGRVRM